MREVSRRASSFMMAAASLSCLPLLLLFLLTAFRRTDPGLARPIKSRWSCLDFYISSFSSFLHPLSSLIPLCRCLFISIIF
jgi:hypothetical protein